MASRTQKQILSDELRTLLRIEKLVLTLAKAALSKELTEILDDKKLCSLYEGAGTVPVKELAKKTGFSAGKLSGLWQGWEQKGLLVKDGGQYRRVL